MTLTYNFIADSKFEITNPTLNLEVQEFPEVCPTPKPESPDEEVSGEAKASKEDSLPLIIGAAVGGTFVLIMIMVIVCYTMRMTRSAKKKEEEEDVDDNPTYGLYAQDTQDEMPTESQVIDENDYYGTT